MWGSIGCKEHFGGIWGDMGGGYEEYGKVRQNIEVFGRNIEFCGKWKSMGSSKNMIKHVVRVM